MRRTPAFAVVALALVGASPASGKLDPLYALRYGAKTNVLVPYDSARLVPIAWRPTIRTGPFAHAWSLSPDRSRFVAAAGWRVLKGQPVALRFVDLAAGRVEGTLSLPGEFRRATATTWVGDRVLVVVSGSDSTTVYSIDPDKRALISKVEIDGAVVVGERARTGVVLLLAKSNVIGPATLAIIDETPRARTVILDRITVGTTESGTGQERRMTVRRPGLALAPSERRVYVVGAHEPTATIDLRTLAIRYSTMRHTTAATKRAEGSVRTAATLRDGRIVVGGFDYGVPGSTILQLVNPSNWSSRTLSRTSSWFRVADRLLFISGPGGSGLRMIMPSGVAVELFRTGSVSDVQVAHSRAFVRFFGRRQKAAVIHLDSGRTLRQTVPANLLIDLGQPIRG